MQYYKSNITVYNITVRKKTKTVFNCFKGMGFVLCSYKCLSLSFESSFELQMGNPKWRYKDLENRRHVGLGQEASSGTGGTRTSITRRHVGLRKRGGKDILTNNEGGNVVPEN